MEKTFTCIVCPLGCTLTAEVQNNQVISVSGNTCGRGEQYAKDECLNPMRTVTTTMRCVGGKIVPVKTEQPIPKDKVFACMKIINATIAPLHISAGGVIIENVFGSRIIATADR